VATVYRHSLIDYLRHCINSGQDEREILGQMTTQEIKDLDLTIDELQNYIHTEMEKREVIFKNR